MDGHVGARWRRSVAATTLGAVGQPTATVDPETAGAVDVSWPEATGPAPASGDAVRAVSGADGSSRTPAGTCAGVVATPTCRDTAVPAGSWRDVVDVVVQEWIGPDSPSINPVEVTWALGPRCRGPRSACPGAGGSIGDHVDRPESTP